MKATTFRTATFGPYALDVRLGELRKFGTKIKMGEQSFRILSLLLETPGEMVTREELRAKLWAEDTFVDFDHGLNSAVQRLRDCLSDSAGKPRWVETIPRRGYRFLGEVEWSDSAAVDGPPESSVATHNGTWHAEVRPSSSENLLDGSVQEAARAKGRRVFVFMVATVLLIAAYASR